MYNEAAMWISSDVMLLILLLGVLGMELLAVFFLRRCRIHLLAYLGWGLLAVLLPAVGPFLVILSLSGQGRRRH
jgi:hypothetical protein